MKVTTSFKSGITFKNIAVGELFCQYGFLYIKISEDEAGRITDSYGSLSEDTRYPFKDFESVARIREIHLVLEE